MYVFGAIDHAAALARVGKLLGYRVTVCDARAAFVTPERFPEADELVVDWPDRFLREAPVDAGTVICVLTHDEKFDVPALIAALETPAVYIGAMGSKVTTADREERLRAEGVDDAGLGRIHAPIGLAIGARSPEEVAVAIGAEIVEATASRAGGGRHRRGLAPLGLERPRAPCRRPREPRSVARYLTVSVPFMPAAAWPGTVQRNAYLPFFRVVLSVAALPVLSMRVFLPEILKSWLSAPLFVTLNVVMPLPIVFFETVILNSLGLPSVTVTVVASVELAPPNADIAATSETIAIRTTSADPFRNVLKKSS